MYIYIYIYNRFVVGKVLNIINNRVFIDLMDKQIKERLLRYSELDVNTAAYNHQA